MTKDKALELALEVIKLANSSHDTMLLSDPPQSAWRYHNVDMKLREAITAIKAALEAKDEPVALAWAEGYQMGVADERTSEANIGIAGFNAKVEPARENPYVNTPSQQKAKDEPWEQFYPEMGKPYAFEALMYPKVIIDPVTGNVSIGTVTKACGLECDCTDVCKQDDYKALWQQMCERCDELDKKLAQREHGWTPERIAGMARLKAQQDKRLEPQRTWVGLTDEEIWACLPKDPDEMVFARAIEAKLKEKNT
jgi:hypothetical protein